MFQFVAYNFCADGDCLDNAPSLINGITESTLSNGIFNHFNVTKDVTSPITTEIPEWDYSTILNANFNGNIDAGNLNFAVEALTGIAVKRRIKGTFDWLTVKTIPIKQISDINFIVNDYFNQNFQDYEYAFVPLLNGTEGNYIINEIQSRFRGVYVCDANNIYKLLAEVGYGNLTQVQKVGVHEPFGRKYPIVTANGATSYKTGELTALILDDNYDNTRALDKFAAVQRRNNLLEFMTNKKAKILKDWNGAIWLVMVTGNPDISFDNNTGMALASITATWTEIGNPNIQEDLYASGLVEEIQ